MAQDNWNRNPPAKRATNAYHPRSTTLFPSVTAGTRIYFSGGHATGFWTVDAETLSSSPWCRSVLPKYFAYPSQVHNLTDWASPDGIILPSCSRPHHSFERLSLTSPHLTSPSDWLGEFDKTAQQSIFFRTGSIHYKEQYYGEASTENW